MKCTCLTRYYIIAYNSPSPPLNKQHQPTDFCKVNFIQSNSACSLPLYIIFQQIHISFISSADLCGMWPRDTPSVTMATRLTNRYQPVVAWILASFMIICRAEFGDIFRIVMRASLHICSACVYLNRVQIVFSLI